MNASGRRGAGDRSLGEEDAATGVAVARPGRHLLHRTRAQPHTATHVTMTAADRTRESVSVLLHEAHKCSRRHESVARRAPA